MELVQIATCTGPKSVHVATSTSLPVQVATCTNSMYKSCTRYLYKLQLVQNLNLYITYILILMTLSLNLKNSCGMQRIDLLITNVYV